MEGKKEKEQRDIAQVSKLPKERKKSCTKRSFSSIHHIHTHAHLDQAV
jgi:hypothetical protein